MNVDKKEIIVYAHSVSYDCFALHVSYTFKCSVVAIIMYNVLYSADEILN